MYAGLNPDSNIPRITLQIIDLENLIKSLKWWQILKRMELQNKLVDLRMEAWNIGMAIAIKDLEKMGILKGITNHKEI